MKGGESEALVTQYNSERPDASIPKRKSDNSDLNNDEDEPQEITTKNNDDHQEYENDGKQNEYMEGSEDINFFYAENMTQSCFLFI